MSASTLNSVSYWTTEFAKNKITVNEFAEKLDKKIESMVSKLVDEYKQNDRHKIIKNLETHYEAEKENKFEFERKKLETLENELKEKEIAIENEAQKTLISEPKYVAAAAAVNRLVEIAFQKTIAKKINENHAGAYTWTLLMPNGDEDQSSCYKNQNDFEIDPGSRQQLIRSIGLIWSAALGMESIG